MTLKEVTQEIKEQIRDTIPQSIQNEFDQAGIYSISCDGKIVYIGQSKNITKRLIEHLFNTYHPTSKDYNSKKYQELRKAKELGHELVFAPIEFCNPYTSLLKERECYYIQKYMPALNTQIPYDGGKHWHNKEVTSIC